MPFVSAIATGVSALGAGAGVAGATSAAGGVLTGGGFAGITAGGALKGIGGAMSMAQGLDAGKRSDALAGQAQRSAANQQQMGQSAFETYDQYGRPVVEGMLGMAARGVHPGFYEDRALADVGQRFDSAQGQLQRGLERRGIQYGGGQAQQALTQMALARAVAESAARTGARRDAEETNWRRMLQGSQTAQQSLNQAQGGQAQAANQLAGLSSTYAKDAASGIGAGIGMLGKMAGQMNGQRDNAGDNAVGGAMTSRGPTIPQAGNVNFSLGGAPDFSLGGAPDFSGMLNP